MRRFVIPLLALCVATPATAQEASGGDAVAGVRGLYEIVKGYILASAEQMPEENYSYRPVEEVRSFGQIIGHVANAGYMFCSAALAEDSPSQQDAEELASKADLVAALQGSFEYCDRAYAMDTATALTMTTVFGQERTKLMALEFNMGHDFEHYGNLVTYMRSNGMVPPSSQRGGGE